MRLKLEFLILLMAALSFCCNNFQPNDKKSIVSSEKLEGVFLSLYPEMTDEEFYESLLNEKKNGTLWGDMNKNSVSYFPLKIDDYTNLTFNIKRNNYGSIRLSENLDQIYDAKSIVMRLLNQYKTKYNYQGTLKLPIYSHIDNAENIYIYNDTINDYKKKLDFKTYNFCSYSFCQSKYHVFTNNNRVILIGYKIRKAFKNVGDVLDVNHSDYNDKMEDLFIEIDYFSNSHFNNFKSTIEEHFNDKKLEYDNSILENKIKRQQYDSIARINKLKI